MNPQDRLAQLDAVPLWLGTKAADAVRAGEAAEEVMESSEQSIRERVAAFDGQVIAQLRNVSVPRDLKGQILASLSSATAPGVAEANETGEEAQKIAQSSREFSRSGFSRRAFNRWTIGAAITAACLGFVALGLSFWWNTEPLTVTGIIADVETSIKEHPVFWEPAQQGTPPQGLTVPTQYLAEDSKGFRTLPLLGTQVVAHDLRIGTPAARLFVIPTDREISSPLKIDGPPYNPQSDTDGRCIGVWHSKDKSLVYVLIVEGDVNDYRRLVRSRAAA